MNQVLLIIMVVLLAVIAFFTSTEVRKCEGEGLVHLQHQLDELTDTAVHYHRYIKN